MPEITLNNLAVALLQGRCTVVYRDWAPEYARQFHAGAIINALDKRRNWGGHAIGAVEVKGPAVRVQSNQLPKTDYEASGFAFLEETQKQVVSCWTPRALWRSFHISPRPLYVLRFELVSTTAYGEELLAGFLAAREEAQPALPMEAEA